MGQRLGDGDFRSTRFFRKAGTRTWVARLHIDFHQISFSITFSHVVLPVLGPTIRAREQRRDKDANDASA